MVSFTEDRSGRTTTEFSSRQLKTRDPRRFRRAEIDLPGAGGVLAAKDEFVMPRRQALQRRGRRRSDGRGRRRGGQRRGRG